MKRIILTITALILISLCACNGAESDSAAVQSPEQITQAPETPTTEEITQAPANPTPEQATPISSPTDSSSTTGQEAEPQEFIDDGEVPGWWGEYKSDEAYCSISITNFNGTSFNFDIYFLRDGHLLYQGVAAIISDDKLMAECGEFMFSLGEDYNEIGISVLESSEWSHLSAQYERIDDNDNVTNQVQYDMWLDFWLEGLVWENNGEYTLDGEVKVYNDILGGGNDLQVQIENYLSLQDQEVSEWLSLEEDEELSEKVGYPVWVAEYYVGYEEDTNLCMDAVVLAGEVNDYTLILHTIRDADLDMNSDTDFGARIKELLATIQVMSD